MLTLAPFTFCANNVPGTDPIRAMDMARRCGFHTIELSAIDGISEQIVAERKLTTLMVTHNMNDAIRLGNRLIMMHEGHVIYDVAGDEKKSLTVADLLQKFEEVSGGELANDRMLLS